MNHCFAVPAYGHSPYLGACLASLQTQTVAGHIVVVTSTPSEALAAGVAAHGLQLVVHGPAGGIACDWNAALDAAGIDCDWVTIAHQDDVYNSGYVAAVLEAVRTRPDATLVFTDYRELLPDGAQRPATALLKVKRLLLELGFWGGNAIGAGWRKRMCLRFGSPIPCPSVAMRADRAFRFDPSYRVSLDWAAWLGMANAPGAFAWVRRPLMAHRIHPASETTAAISQGYRGEEDERILRELWPGWIARMIVRSFRLAYASNKG